MAKQHLDIAIVGKDGSGKTALCERFQQEAAREGDITLHFDEHHSHEEMDCEVHNVVLQVLDATRLEEALMLTSSFIDHRHHLVLLINRYDLLLQTGHKLDIEKFRELIGVPVCLVSAQTGQGIREALHLLRQVAQQDKSHAHELVHGWEQTDEEAYRAFVHGILHQTLIHPKADKHTILEHIDAVLTNKWLGTLILIAIMAFVFWLTFTLGDPIGNWLDGGIVWLHDLILSTLGNNWYSSLLSEGIVMGVGSLLTALPNIIILFFFLSLMEDMGYMARVAYLMDSIMHHIGLHGRSFIPMLMGFDCNVPAIIAAKDIANPKDRALTMLMVPFMSCSARLPVYILFISAFFAQRKALVLGSLYLLGILISFLFAWLMKRTKWFRTSSDDCVNELPYFKMPTARSIAGHIWYRVSDFLQKISTVVLCASVIIWALEYFPSHDLNHLDSSWLAMIGQWLTPIMQPLGFDWRLSVCLLTGLPAKEAIAATFAILFGGDAASILASGMSPLTAYAFLVFTLLYFPCVATIATIRREVNWKWALFSVVNSLCVAWICAFLVQWIGGML